MIVGFFDRQRKFDHTKLSSCVGRDENVIIPFFLIHRNPISTVHHPFCCNTEPLSLPCILQLGGCLAHKFGLTTAHQDKLCVWSVQSCPAHIKTAQDKYLSAMPTRVQITVMGTPKQLQPDCARADQWPNQLGL